MNTAKELEKIRKSVTKSVVTAFDRLIEGLENPCSDNKNTDELKIPLSADPVIFINKKPVAVLFGEERVNVKTWREVYGVILTRCNKNPEHHETLMYLRDKAAGKCRVFLSGSFNGMTRPLKIDEGLYGETHYGSQTLMRVTR